MAYKKDEVIIKAIDFDSIQVGDHAELKKSSLMH